jgi:hypothetical protein
MAAQLRTWNVAEQMSRRDRKLGQDRGKVGLRR